MWLLGHAHSRGSAAAGGGAPLWHYSLREGKGLCGKQGMVAGGRKEGQTREEEEEGLLLYLVCEDDAARATVRWATNRVPRNTQVSHYHQHARLPSAHRP